MLSQYCSSMTLSNLSKWRYRKQKLLVRKMGILRIQVNRFEYAVLYALYYAWYSR